MPVGKSDINALANFKPPGRGSNDWFRPRAEGDGSVKRHKFRLCPPYRADLEVPLIFGTMHYLGHYGQQNTLAGACPGDGCPACKLFFGAIKQADQTLKDALRVIAPSQRAYANVVVREDESIRVWSIPVGGPKSLGAGLIGIVSDYANEGVDLSHPTKGRDLVLPVEAGFGGKGITYGAISVLPRSSKIGVDGWEGMLHDLEAMANAKVLTIEEIESHIPDLLGEFYNDVVALGGGGKSSARASAPKTPKKKTTRKAKTTGGGKKKKTTTRKKK